MDPDELAERLRGLPDDPEGPAQGAQGSCRAAVAILLRTRAGAPEVLLIRRAERDGDRWSGQIGLPGGHEDAADPDLYATALREVREEVGLDLEHGARWVGKLRPVQAKARGILFQTWITPFVFCSTAELDPRPSPEAVEAFWFPLGSARAGELASTHRYVREGVERVLPAWRFGERVVWGLTYEILSGFLRIAP